MDKQGPPKSAFEQVIEAEIKITIGRYNSVPKYSYTEGIKSGRIDGLKYALRLYNELREQRRIVEIPRGTKCESQE